MLQEVEVDYVCMLWWLFQIRAGESCNGGDTADG
jgi:hypothetical protein